jgi:alanine racemase
MCRVGLGIYGLRPTPESGRELDLIPAMKVVSHVRYMRRLPRSARPSYGRIRELEGSHNVATIPIGYADGVNRSLSRSGSVLINTKRYRFAGQITMDMVIVDLGDDDAQVGDEVVLIGVQGDDRITVEEWADMLGTISYEVVCHFGPRLPRRYIRSRHDDG